MKKLLLTLALCSSTEIQAKGFQGFYLGIDAGVNHTRSEFNLNRTSGTVLFSKTQGHTLNPNMGLFLGYNFLYGNVVTLGFELASDINFGEAGSIHTREGYKITQKRENGSGSLFAKLGFVICDKNHFFAGIGLKHLKNEYRYNNTASSGSFKVTSDDTVFAAQFGFESLVYTDRLAFRVTYGFAGPAKFSGKNPYSSNLANQFAPGAVSAHTTEHLIKAGLSYRF